MAGTAHANSCAANKFSKLNEWSLSRVTTAAAQ
jgi:hypothetical protein